jgi:uncharacterized protein
MMPNVKTSLIVIQPTPFCNIDCSYCYLPGRRDRSVLSMEKIEVIFRKLLRFPTVSQSITIVWHAGEPLVLGPKYYDDAFSRIRDLCPKDLRIAHSFQTNGMLITDAWCDLIQKWGVSVGVSVDGPKHIHDASRKTRSGKGTYDKATEGIRCLQKRAIPFYVITVLTESSLAHPEALFSFYEEFGINDLGFNIEEQEGVHRNSSLNSSHDGAIIVEFFKRFGELMVERNFPIAVRELEQTLLSIRFLSTQPIPNDQVIPFGIITIDVSGNVYTYSPELVGYSSHDFPTFSIGNILENSFEDMEASDVLGRLRSEIDRGVAACAAECDYFAICGGGAPSNKLFENKSFGSTETMFCRLTKKRVADFLLAAIEGKFVYPKVTRLTSNPSGRATALSDTLGSKHV